MGKINEQKISINNKEIVIKMSVFARWKLWF